MSPPGQPPSSPDRTVSAQRLLAACRGAASLRLIRWGRETGVDVVTLFSDKDTDANWPELADFATWVPEVPGEAWPAPEEAVAAAMDAGCDLIHPGWGALARSPAFVDQLSMTSLAWAGPLPRRHGHRVRPGNCAGTGGRAGHSGGARLAPH